MALKLFTTFTVVAAILASPKDFTWNYRSSIYRVRWLKHDLSAILDYQGFTYYVKSGFINILILTNNDQYKPETRF